MSVTQRHSRGDRGRGGGRCAVVEIAAPLLPSGLWTRPESAIPRSSGPLLVIALVVYRIRPRLYAATWSAQQRAADVAQHV
jgi:hypothetical protein